MGMYDEIICKYPLPDPQCQYHVFQTKDLEQNMYRYSITSEGRLVLFPMMVDDHSLQYIHNMEDPQVIDLDGKILFYTLIYCRETNEHEFYEYVAHFDKGRLMCIERI